MYDTGRPALSTVLLVTKEIQEETCPVFLQASRLSKWKYILKLQLFPDLILAGLKGANLGQKSRQSPSHTGQPPIHAIVQTSMSSASIWRRPGQTLGHFLNIM